MPAVSLVQAVEVTVVVVPGEPLAWVAPEALEGHPAMLCHHVAAAWQRNLRHRHLHVDLGYMASSCIAIWLMTAVMGKPPDD